LLYSCASETNRVASSTFDCQTGFANQGKEALMKNSLVAFSRLSIVLLAGLSLYACGEKPSEPAASAPSEPVAEKPAERAVREEALHATATVEAIDAKTREIKLKGENESFSFIAGPEVRNFDNIHVGDKVTVSYFEALIAELKPKGAPATEPTAAGSLQRAPVGGMPSASADRIVTLPVKIESYDTATDIVVFTDPSGVRHTIPVQAPSMKELGRTLKPGDEVELTFVDAIAVDVAPAP